MGRIYQTRCRGCGHQFTVAEGGGFSFHQLRCEKCGRTKSISFDELGEIHLRYLKGLDGPYAIVTEHNDRFIKDNFHGEPLPEREYRQAVEAKVGNCRCRGRYTFDASPRCPKCRSTDLEEVETTVHFD